MAPRTGSSRGIAGSAALLGALAFAPLVHAQPADPSAALAQTLFAEGRTLMNESRYEEACLKLSESYRMVQASGTLLNLGLCHEKIGKLASAYGELGESLSRAIKESRPEREKLAREHLAIIEGKVARVTIVVPPDAELSGLELRLDGQPLRKPSWGVRTPIDPGEHTVEAAAPGREPFKRRVSVTGESETHSVEIPVLAPAARAEALRRPATERVAEAPRPSDAPPKAAWSAQRWVGLGVGSVGLVAAGLGVGFTVVATNKWSDAKDRCGALTCTSAADKAVGTDAGTAADIATALFLVSGVMVVAGGVLFFTAPSTSKAALRVTPVAGPHSAGLFVGGAL